MVGVKFGTQRTEQPGISKKNRFFPGNNVIVKEFLPTVLLRRLDI
jgi:hypothetical protein